MNWELLIKIVQGTRCNRAPAGYKAYFKAGAEKAANIDYSLDAGDSGGGDSGGGASLTNKRNVGGIDGLSMGVEGVKVLQEKPISLAKWVEKYGKWSQAEIALENGKDTFGLPKGPPLQWRFVINPYDGKTMDMRHVAVVGYAMGEVNGLGAEMVQKVVGLLGFDDGKSAFNPQDKYSNNIGSSFFNYDWHHNGLDMSNNFGNRFNEFLKIVYNK